MEEIFKEVFTLKFLILVVLTSIILNIIASYLKDLLDKGISKLSSSYYDKMKLKKEEALKFDNILLESEEFRNIHRDEAIFERIRSTWFLVLSVFVFIIVSMIELNKITVLNELNKYGIFVGFIALLLSMKYIISSTKKWNRAFKSSNANKS
ncbi:hypothetical protein [Halarcobacter anaerophilus]|uniref:hypothetical protein n=1 Tax=Halarcobacter anaerophilus TaxID=877500 RepID=UPI0005CABEB7|nr:hypothetical protein [Halarcobacter anaerophilus]